MEKYEVKLRELSLPLNPEMMCTDHKGQPKKSLYKQNFRILRPFANHLRHVLQEGETIQHVTRAMSPTSTLEFLFTGWIIYYLKRALLVFTDRRILHLFATVDNRPRPSLAQIDYGDVSEINKSGQIRFTYNKDKKKEIFYQVPWRNRQKIRASLPLWSLGKSPSPRGKRYHICPRCQEALEEKRYTCQKCKLQFKDMDTATRLSWIFPGGGYFYTGHPLMGIGDALTEIFLIALVVLFLVMGGAEGSQGKEGIWFLGGFFLFILVFEKLLTVFHARHFIKEYIPLDRKQALGPSVWGKPNPRPLA